jgi:hypothetical protein
MPTATPVHPFARFGAGPYTFVSLETTEDREEKNAAAERSGLPFTTNMCGGSCDLCGTAIWNVYTFATAEGRKFKVGCDCAEKAGERHLVREGDRMHRDAKRAEKTRERMETERRTREQRLESERVANDAAGHGRLTNDELAAKIVADREAAMQARRDASRHIGTIGERIKSVLVRYEGCYRLEFGGRLIFLRTVEGHHAIVWKTDGCLFKTRADGTIEPFEEGETFTSAFTVKKHSQYRGEFQTNVKVLKVMVPKVKKPRETKAAREQRLADKAASEAAEARAKIQRRIDSAHRCAEMARENIAKGEAGHFYCSQHVDAYRTGLAESEAEIAALVAEMEATS